MVSWHDEVSGDTPFAWWKFSEASGSNADDHMAGNHDGTHVNSPTVGIIGSENRAVSYLGTSSQYTNVGTLGSFASSATTNGMSFEVIARWSNTDTQALFAVIVGSSTLCALYANRNNTGSNNTGGRIHAQVRGDTGSVSSRASTQQDMADGNWHHLVFTHPGATGVSLAPNVYVDGSLSNGADTNGAIGAWADWAHPLFIAATSTSGTPGAFYTGDVDEVVLYDRVLTATEVSDHYAADRTPATAGFVRSQVVIIG